MERFKIEGVEVSISTLRPDGHAAEGWIFANPETPDWATATYTYVPDRYDVKPCWGQPNDSRNGTGYDLAAAVRIAKKWVQKTEEED